MTTAQHDSDIDLALDDTGANTAAQLNPWQVVSWLAFAFMLLALVVTAVNRNNPDVVGPAAISGLLFATISLIAGRETR